MSREWIEHQDNNGETIFRVGDTVETGGIRYELGTCFRPGMSIIEINITRRSITTHNEGFGNFQMTYSKNIPEEDFYNEIKKRLIWQQV